MKKLFVILSSVLFAAGLFAPLEAQAPFSKYKTSVTTGAQTYHTLGNGATVLWTPSSTDTLNRRLLVSATDRIPLQDGQKYPVTFSFGKEMTFGPEKFSTAGVFADGFVFFGSRIEEGDSEDSIRPVVHAENFYAMTTNRNFLYSAFLNADGMSGALLLGGENSKIGYETVDDILYIAYENILVKTSEENSAVVSWNYALNLATGEISLQTKDFSLSGETAFQYGFALVASADFVSMDALWLATWGGQTDQTLRLMGWSSTNNPNDSVYHFNLPVACGKIADFGMTWDDQFSSVEDQRINLGFPSWNDGEKALFILSEEETLSGDNLPKDGVLYRDGSKIGTSAGVRIGGRDMFGCFVDGVFNDLKPGTTYYVHAFGYNDSCSGIRYSDVKTKSYKTLMGSPKKETIVLGEIGLETIQVILPTAETGLSYVVAVSENPIEDLDTKEAYGNILKDGQTYTANQQVVDDFGAYELTIKQVDMAAGTCTIEGLKNGTVYHIAVWYMTTEGGASAYSFRPAVVSTKTVMRIPVSIDFEEEEILTQPIGWKISKDGEDYGFEVRYYGESKEGGIDDGGIAIFGMAKAPKSGSKLLVSQLNYIPEDYEAAPQYRNMSAYAVTPVFHKAENPNLRALFNMGIYTQESEISSETAYRPQDGDSIVISWAESQNAENWIRLEKLDKNTRWDRDGFVSLSTSAISPVSTFCYKVEYFFRADKDASSGVMFAIENLEVEEDLPCKYPTDMTVSEDALGATSALLSWEDGNIGAGAQSFILSYQAQGQTDWDTVRPYPTEVSHRLNDLRPGMDYTVRIQAVCGDKGTSLVKTTEFRTLDTISYEIDILNGSGVFPTGFVNARGVLGTEPESIEEDGWQMGSDCAGFSILNLQLAANSHSWLKLPVLVSTHDAMVNVSTSLFNYKNAYGSWEEPEGNNDTLWVFVSENGKFGSSNRRLVGAVALNDLEFGLEEIGDMIYSPKYNEKILAFDAEAGKKYTVAYYIPSLGADPEAEDININNLAISKIKLTYGDIIYPAVTDIYTRDLGKTSVSVLWEGNADSYVLIYKTRSAEKYDTVETDAKRVDLTELQSGTSYEYRVYGIYGGVAGRLSEPKYFVTIAECAVPENFSIVKTFWDGARISGHSDNRRLIHIKSEGEIVEYYVNTILEWSAVNLDTLRLRGLQVAGVGYPYSVRLRAVCNPGDSSAWTEPLIFRTAEYPEIGLPTNLKSVFNPSNRSATLSWTPGVNNDVTYIYFKKAGASRYDTTGTLSNTYTLLNLETNVVYKWCLQPGYDTYLIGGVTQEEDLSTAVANEGASYAEALRIRANNRQIVVENPEGRYIRTIKVYDIAGRLLKSYPVDDRGNVFVNTDLEQGVVLIEVLGSASERAVSKTVIVY